MHTTKQIARKKVAIKKRLRHAGLPYRRVAPLVGVSYQYLSDILNGKRGHAGYALCARLDAHLSKIEARDEFLRKAEASRPQNGQRRAA